jgi:hypothetical protein
VLYSQAFLLCLAASFVNPYFYQLHQHVLAYLIDGYQMKHIGEFQSISFHHPVALFFEVLLGLGIAAACWNVTRRNFAAAILILGWAHLALVSGRNIPIYAIVASPFIAEALSVWILQLRSAESAWLSRASSSLGQFCANLNAVESIPRLHIVSGAIVWLIGSILYVAAPPVKFQAEYDAATFPARAIDKLQEQKLTSRIFSTDDWSGYVIYRLYPTVKVFIDGRSDFYGPKFGEEFTEVLDVKYNWDDRLKAYGVETILLPVSSHLSAALKGSSRWRCIYDDGVAIVFHSAAGSEQVSAALSGERKPVL